MGYKVKKGTDIKLQVIIEDLPDGLAQQDIDFSVSFLVGDTKQDFTKAQLKNPEYGVFIAPIETKSLNRGDMWMNIDISIPDTDFLDGVRNDLQTVKCDVQII